MDTKTEPLTYRFETDTLTPSGKALYDLIAVLCWLPKPLWFILRHPVKVLAIILVAIFTYGALVGFWSTVATIAANAMGIAAPSRFSWVASQPTTPSTSVALGTGTWYVYAREPHQQPGQSTHGIIAHPTKEACYDALEAHARQQLLVTQAPINLKAGNYTVEVDKSPPDRIRWTKHYHGKTKLGGAPLNPDNAPDVYERWCAEQQ